ncbi:MULTISPECIES: pyridoxamine 5'-phosphate oxidase family protein [unclassified Rhodococcus (in: high G+C Gram-positive bacteria)]|uniref:pyridoxamine 5'-phosphate oxidase family protein n=1 Tax=unclassified Rhodococcus (in: high G+C Gram-positive bacteria) TaxID=192944 RepID=UPI0002A2198C|nr:MULTISPECIES: pyridoxamine 5'-phosphate oxidase family protein [unclassified Rhodococcus (in: high G+C Gram-positive bacteria)]ELB93437.1 hypothetical protein Rwratislav_08952 [Rhodococcus wratislaviensis IFP 2016]MBC2637484.1 pyridoxamine 5'-phosphate oxidase family protein [Rhodococcus sp. 3A]MBC2898214.1 pyridoxamine 5'-phosphate oxidase family protein [Rhodococcus sp. 4CII]
MATTAPDSALPVAECIRLLRSVPVGRMVFTDNALPALRPVTFAAIGGDVVIPTDDETFERFDGEFLAFEAGDIDLITRTGWSVTAMGKATYVSFAETMARFHDQSAVPWSTHPGDYHLILDMEYVSGRRVTLIRRPGDNR